MDLGLLKIIIRLLSVDLKAKSPLASFSVLLSRFNVFGRFIFVRFVYERLLDTIILIGNTRLVLGG